MSDGSVTFKAELDDKQAQEELNRLTKKIDTLNNKISDKQQQKMPLVEQSKQIAVNLDEAKARLDQMKSGNNFFTSDSVKAQEQTVKSLQKEWDGTQAKVEKIDASIKADTANLERMKNNAADLSGQLAGAGKNLRNISPAAEAASKRIEKVINRIKGLAKRVLFFTVVARAFRSIKDYLWSAIKTNNAAVESVARLKASLLTLAQPIISAVIPAFTLLVDVITSVVNVIAKLVSMVFGTTAKNSAEAAEKLYDEQNALNGVGKSSKKASKSLASFDEINQLVFNTASSSGTNGIVPDFSAIKSRILSSLTFTLDDIIFKWEDLTAEDILSKIIVLLSTICGGIIGWTIGGPFGAIIGILIGAGIGLLISNIAFDGDGVLSQEEILGAVIMALSALAGGILGFVIGGPGGAALGVLLGAGISLAIKKILFNNDGSVDSDEIINLLIVALSAIAGGLIGFAVGGVPGAVIGAVVGAGIVLSIANIGFENLGIDSKKLLGGLVEALVAVAGGLIGFAVGGPAGAVVGATLGIVLSLGIDKVFFKDKKSERAGSFEGKVIGDNVNNGARKALGIHSPSTEFQEMGMYCMEGIANGITKNQNLAISAFQVVMDSIQLSFNTWQLNFSNGFNSFQKSFTQLWSNFWNLMCVTFTTKWNNILRTLQNGVNNAIDALNSLVNKANGLSGLTGGSYRRIGHINVPLVSIPKLAQGAVIPQNREFMAVLGDQKSGTNIETPLATMVDAFKQAMSEYGGGTTTVVLQLDGKEIARSTVKNINNMTRAAGKPVLLY